MAVTNKNEMILGRKFDPKTCRHSMNGRVQVLHCHHYATLYTQLADDCGMLDGARLLADVAEDTFYDSLTNYYKQHNVTELADRISLAEQSYSVAGLGQIKITCASPDSGEAELTHSHIDQGWIAKWGKRDKPVNFITCGYISGLFSAIFDKPRRSYSVFETQSIVSGAETSRFEAVGK